MTTRVTIQISQAHQPVDVQVLTRQRDGSFAAPMPATRIEREGDVVTFHVHANQRLQVIEAEALAQPVPPPLPAASAASPDDADEAAVGVNTFEDTDHA